MNSNLHRAKKHFENALANVKINDSVTSEFIKGLIELTKFLEAADNKLEQIQSNTA